MRYLALNIKYGTALAVMMMAMGPVVSQAQRPTEKVQFSEPSVPIEKPAWNKSSLEPGEFNLVDKKSFRLLEFNPPNKSLGMVFDPPRSMFLNQHAKDLLEERKNWAFTDLNELYPRTSMEEMLDVKPAGLNDKAKNSLSPMDRFYRNLDERTSGKMTNQWQKGNSTTEAADEFYAKNGFDPLGGAFKDSDAFMKKMFSPGKEDSEKTATMLASPSSEDATAKEAKDEQKRYENFKRVVLGDTSVVLPKPDILGSLFQSQDDNIPPTKTAADIYADLQKKAAEPYKSVLYPTEATAVDPTASPFHSHVYDDPTARALGLPNPTVIKPVERPSVTAQSVQKMLDPFAGNRMQRKFE